MNSSVVIECIELIKSAQSDEELRNGLLHFHENDIAKAFPLLEKNERQRLYKVVDQEVLSDIFSYLDDPEIYFDEMSEDKLTDIFETMDTDDIVDVLDDLEEEKQKELVELLDDASLKEVQLIQSYDDDMIGSKMTTNYISLEKGLTVKQAMRSVISQAAENDNVSTIYFTENGMFYGAMELRDLIRAREYDKLDDLIVTNYPYLVATDDAGEVLGKLQDYALNSVPVVDENCKLIGVITSDDVVEVMEEEMGEDYAKLAGLSEEEELEESIFKSVKRRIPWLVILLGLGLLTSVLLSRFENVVSAVPIIVFFQTLILSMAGNTGTQSLAVTIRAISDDNFNKKDRRKLVFKEIRIGLLNGLLIGILTTICIFVFLLIIEDISIIEISKISISVGVSMVVSMTVACASGSLIPIIFKKCKIDPAVASGPFITTLNDVIAIAIYYGLAWLLLLNL